MASYLVLAIYAVFFLYQLYKYCVNRPNNFPPGPPRIPFIGGYFLLFFINFHNLHLAIQALCKRYKTKVLGIYFGDTAVAIAHDPDSVREVLFNPDFDGRNEIYLARLRAFNFKFQGIFFTDGMYWQDQRRFTLRNMRDFGFGRRYEEYELEVRSEMECLVNMLKEGPKYPHEEAFLQKGGIASFPRALITSVGNCFLQVVANERLPRSEQEKIYLAGLGSIQFQINSDEFGKSLSIFPWLRNIIPGWSRYTKLRTASMAMFDFMKEFVDKQIATYQEGHIRNFMDTYIKEMEEEDGSARGYLYDQMVMICTDFLFPSLSAIEAQVSFLLRHLLHRNDILTKIQSEIDDVVGRGRLPNLDDRVHMPYTESALRESMRYDTLVPSSVPHRAMVDTKLGGFDIPKDSAILASLYALHTDKQLWKDPENFRPERFLNAKGELSLKLDKSLPFGGGRRLCAGETFARNTMFLVTAALLQNFDIEAVGEKPGIDDTVCGLIRLPNDFLLKFTSR